MFYRDRVGYLKSMVIPVGCSYREHAIQCLRLVVIVNVSIKLGIFIANDKTWWQCWAVYQAMKISLNCGLYKVNDETQWMFL